MYNLDIHVKPQKIKLYISNPQQKKIGALNEAYQIKQTLKLGNINTLEFSIPYQIEKDHELIDNPNINKIKHRFYIKAKIGLLEEWYIITEISEEMDGDKDVMHVVTKSIGYELQDKLIRGLERESQNAKMILDIVLGETLWSVGDIDTKFLGLYRRFDFTSSTVLECVFQIAETFGAIIIWDTIQRKIHLKEPANIGQNLGLKINYGKYLKSMNKQEKADEGCVTRFRAFGEDELSFHTVNPTGQNYIENFAYFIYPFERDENRNVIQESDYMSNELCHALLDYKILLDSKEPIDKIGEYGTSPTQIIITNHGLVTGDYIINKTRENAKRKVTVINANTLQVDAVENQNEDDEFELYFTGTFGKLLFRKEEQQAILTTKQNELDALETELAIIQDSLDAKKALGQSTTQLEADKSAKLTQISSKEAEVNSQQAVIDGIDDEIATFRSQISVENNFTFEQIKERNKYIIEREWSDTNYIDAKDLYDEAKVRFEEIISPALTLDLDIVNFLEILEAQKDWGKLNLGDTIHIRYDRIHVNVKAKITEVTFDYEDGNVNIVIANINKINDDEALAKLINQSMSTSTTVDMSKYKWNKTEENTTAIEDLVNNIWDANERTIRAGVNESVEIGRRGITIKDPTDPSKMLIAQHGILAISNSGGADWKHAITADGIVAENIYGKLGAFVQVRADQIILGDNGEGLSDDIIDGDKFVQVNKNYNSTYITQDGILVKNGTGDTSVQLGEYEAGKYGLKIKGASGNTVIDQGGILQTWQEGEEDNADGNFPLTLDVYIPNETISVRQAVLRLKMKPFRANSKSVGLTARALGATATAYAGVEFVSFYGGGGYVREDGHAHAIDVGVSFANIYVDYGIHEEGAQTSSIGIKVNGVDRTTELGGTITADKDNINIQPYLQKGWNSIELTATSRIRLSGKIFVQCFMST